MQLEVHVVARVCAGDEADDVGVGDNGDMVITEIAAPKGGHSDWIVSFGSEMA